MQNIPSVNLVDFLSNDPSKKEKFVQQIGRAYEDIGFVALKGHFLDVQLTDQLYKKVKEFYNLPLNIKKKYEIEGLAGQRGYTSFGKESAKDKKEGDSG